MYSNWVRLLLLPILLAGGVAAAHLVPGIDGSELERNIRDSLHIIGFAGVAWILFELAPFGQFGKSVLAFAGALMFGALSELAQWSAGFSFNEVDIVRDAFGAGLMIFARAVWTLGSTRITRVFLRTIAVVAVVAVFVPFGYWGWGILSERLKAPVIIDFESHYTKHYFRSTNSEVVLASNSPADNGQQNRFLEVMLSRAPRSGVLVATALYDWRAYEWLVFDAQISDGTDSVVSVHINDYEGLGHYVDVPAGMVTVTSAKISHRVPIREVLRQTGRSEDPGNIRQIALFARNRNRGTILHIDNLRLE